VSGERPFVEVVVAEAVEVEIVGGKRVFVGEADALFQPGRRHAQIADKS
jgi:hypothetical protein